MARKNALSSSPAGEPRQGVKVCDLLNTGSASLRLHASHKYPRAHLCKLCLRAWQSALFDLRFERGDFETMAFFRQRLDLNL